MSELIKKGCRLCNQKASVFSLLNDEEIDQVDCDRTSIMYYEGEVMFKQGAPCTHMVCITGGLVKLCLENPAYNNMIIDLVRPVTYIYDPGFFSGHYHHFTAIAVEKTEACLIDLSVMKQLMQQNPLFLIGFVERISKQVVDLYHRFSNYSHKHVFGRVADLLLYLYPGIYTEHPVTLTLSRQDLASIAGMTKESLIRVLKKFKEDQIIALSGNQLEILNREKLEAISKSG